MTKSRRDFLKQSGLLLGLPLLQSMGGPLFTMAKRKTFKRLVVIGNTMGVDSKMFFPDAPGKNYKMSGYLKPFEKLRADMSVLGGLDHQQNLGHGAPPTFLSGVLQRDAFRFAEKNISMDQKAADHIWGQTRFPSIQLQVGNADAKLSWTRTGINLPARPVDYFYQQLFVEGGEAEKRQLKKEFDSDKGILDLVYKRAKVFKNEIGREDHHQLDQYFTAIKEVEDKIGQNKKWIDVPKPKAPKNIARQKDSIADMPTAFQLIKLAMLNEASRIFTLDVDVGRYGMKFLLIKKAWHTLTHHGKDAKMLAQLYKIERYMLAQVAAFIQDLKDTDDPLNGGKLLDHTMVMFGSGLGEGYTHLSYNLPIILAGGGANHGEYRQYPMVKGKGQVPMSNLLLSMLQNFGLPIDSFAHSTGPLAGLKWS